MVRVKAAEAGLVLPATSVATAVMACAPSPRAVPGVKLQAPEPSAVVVPREGAPAEYTAPHDLQVVELILDNGETLIDGLYSRAVSNQFASYPAAAK